MGGEDSAEERTLPTSPINSLQATLSGMGTCPSKFKESDEGTKEGGIGGEEVRDEETGVVISGRSGSESLTGVVWVVGRRVRGFGAETMGVLAGRGGLKTFFNLCAARASGERSLDVCGSAGGEAEGSLFG